MPSCPSGALVNGDRGLQALDQIHVRPFHLVQELPGVDRQALDVLPLSLGIQGVEGQGAFSRSARPGENHHPIAGDIEIDVLEVVHLDHSGRKLSNLPDAAPGSKERRTGGGVRRNPLVVYSAGKQ